MKIITIIGLGLIGSSIARAVRKASSDIIINAYNKSEPALKRAKHLGIVDNVSSNVAKSVEGADVVIICTPIGTYAEITKKISPYLKSGAILTDVGSVKQATINAVFPHLTEDQKPFFIPAHPIAGSEKTGVDAGSEDLFLGKRLIITPTEKASQAAIKTITKLWQLCGSEVEVMDADLHDEIYAQVSHLVHFIAFCYWHYLHDNNLSCDNGSEQFKKFIRVTHSSPVMWRDIFLYNKQPVLTAISEFREDLTSNCSQEKHAVNKNDVAYNIMPKIVAKSLKNTTKHKKYAGTAFAGMVTIGVSGNAEALLSDTKKLIMQIDKLQQFIQNDDGNAIAEYIAKN